MLFSQKQSWQPPEGVPDGQQPNPYYGNNFSPVEPLQRVRRGPEQSSFPSGPVR